MRQVWMGNDRCTLDGVPFEYGRANYANLITTAERVWVLKPGTFFDQYDLFLRGSQPQRLLELGIFQGGSALLLADRWDKARMAALDIKPENPAVIEHARRFHFDDRLSFHYGVSQDDEARVLAVIDAKLNGSPDMVIDDASHYYSHSRRSFEIVFPRLAAGGLYVIEDWAWAHWDGWQTPGGQLWEHPALTNLVFELCMLAGSSRNLVSEIHVSRPYVIVRKHCGVMPGPFRLDEHIVNRGQKLVPI